jgi:hypothetical protein
MFMTILGSKKGEVTAGGRNLYNEDLPYMELFR